MRPHLLLAGIIVALITALAGCGSGADMDTLPKSFLSLLDDTTAVLKEVKDVKTATAAEGKLRALAERKKALDVQARTTKLSKADMQESDRRWAGKIAEAGKRMAAESQRIVAASPEATALVARAMGN